MSIEELCTKPVATIDGGATIMQAAAAMRSQNVGDLVVVRRRDGQAVPAGIITDRDIVVEVLGAIAPEVDLDAVAPDKPFRDQVDIDSFDFLVNHTTTHSLLGYMEATGTHRDLTVSPKVPRGTLRGNSSNIWGSPMARWLNWKPNWS